MQLIQYFRFCVSTLITLPVLSSDYPQFSLFMLLISFLVPALAFAHLSASAPLTSSDNNEISDPAICALSKLIIPTSSVWPEWYLSIARSARQTKHFQLVLRTVFRDSRHGVIEVRDPSSYLSLFVKGSLKIDRWTFELGLSLQDKLKTWKWAVSEELSSYPDEVSESILLSNCY